MASDKPDRIAKLRQEKDRLYKGGGDKQESGDKKDSGDKPTAVVKSESKPEKKSGDSSSEPKKPAAKSKSSGSEAA